MDLSYSMSASAICPLLTARLWKLLPPPERRKLDLKKDMGLPSLRGGITMLRDENGPYEVADQPDESPQTGVYPQAL